MDKLVVSAREARDMLAVSNGEMSKLLHEGKVKAFRRGTKWCIPVEELKAFVMREAEADTERRINGK